MGDSRIDDDDRTHLLVSLQPNIPAGTYTVRWFNTSLEDGHEEAGEFGFTIDPNAPTTEATQANAVTPTVAPDPTLPPATAIPALPTPTIAPSTTNLGCFGGLILFPLLLGAIGLTGWSRKGFKR